LWSARFWNEFRTDGTSGTAAAALVDGLQTQNAGEVNAAVAQLAANSADVGGNNLMADGGSYSAVVAAAQATAVTPAVDAAAAVPPAAAPAAPATPAAPAAAGLTATDLFNDATTREIGGVGPDQVNLIVSDLIGVQQMLTAADPTINNLSDLHTHIIINQINDISSTIATAVEEQSATTNEITRNISDGARGSSEIAKNITVVAKAAQSTSLGAHELKKATEDLARMSAELRGLVGQFKYETSENSGGGNRRISQQKGNIRVATVSPEPYI